MGFFRTLIHFNVMSFFYVMVYSCLAVFFLFLVHLFFWGFFRVMVHLNPMSFFYIMIHFNLSVFF